MTADERQLNSEQMSRGVSVSCGFLVKSEAKSRILDGLRLARLCIFCAN